MNWALIMAGGAGTRFWPASRLARPKQLLPIGSSNRTLIQETIQRIKPLIPSERILVLTQKKQIGSIRKALPSIPKKNFIIEPVGRNTAPAIGLGAFIALKKDSNAVIACLPADQIVRDRKKFIRTLQAGFHAAKSGDSHVTFGIPPCSPETGFGYIERGEKIKNSHGLPLFYVKRFVEKPDSAKAKKYLRSGKFYWNSGIFVWKASFLLNSLKLQKPRLYEGLKRITQEFGTSKWEGKLNALYPRLENISIDYALMEKARNVKMIPGNFGWSDMGSWSAFEHIWPKDNFSNASPNPIIAVNSVGNIIDGNSQLVALVGVKDMVVVSTKDAVLVAQKNQVQNVRKVIDELKKKRLNQYL